MSTILTGNELYSYLNQLKENDRIDFKFVECDSTNILFKLDTIDGKRVNSFTKRFDKWANPQFNVDTNYEYYYYEGDMHEFQTQKADWQLDYLSKMDWDGLHIGKIKKEQIQAELKKKYFKLDYVYHMYMKNSADTKQESDGYLTTVNPIVDNTIIGIYTGSLKLESRYIKIELDNDVSSDENLVDVVNKFFEYVDSSKYLNKIAFTKKRQNMASLAINKINILPGLTLIQITFEYDQYSTGNNVGETFNQHISCKDHRFDETEYKNMLNHSRNMPSPLPADWTTYFYTVTNENNEILYGLSDLMYSTYINNVYDMNSSSYTIYKNSVSTNSPLTNTNSQVDKIKE